MKNKKIKGLFTSALLAMTLLAACSEENTTNTEGDGGSKPEEAKITLRLADNQPTDYPTVIGDKKFAELVSERTDGRITIEVFASGQLGDEKSVLEQVQLGAIDFARINASPLAEFLDEFTVFSVPYLFSSDDHLWNFLNGETGVGIARWATGSENARACLL